MTLAKSKVMEQKTTKPVSQSKSSEFDAFLFLMGRELRCYKYLTFNDTI